MRYRHLCFTIVAATLLAAVACTPAPPSGPIVFTAPHLDAGETVRTIVISAFKGGTFEAASSEANTSGSISIERQRTVKKTVLEADETGPTRCSIDIPEDTIKVTLISADSNSVDETTGPLVGRPIEATRKGDTWSLGLIDGIPDADQADALLGIESFENNNWFPGHPVDLGESWDYDPGYFRILLERDLGDVAATGRMTLRSLETHPDGTHQARLDLTITSSGIETSSGDLAREAEIEARGTLIVNLESMLDREMIIEGTLRSGVSNSSSSASIEMPFRIQVRREILTRG